MPRNRLVNLQQGSQRGAALVIGLILLMILTLLAVAGVNSASLEFIMAGNEQFHQNAFQAAETGIEESIATGQFNPAAAAPENIAANMPNAPSDQYAATISAVNPGIADPIWWGSDQGITAYQFEINSIGTAVRSSSATNTQGVAVIAKTDNTLGADKANNGTDQLTGP